MCVDFDTRRTMVNDTSLRQNLPCGQTYVFTIRAVTQLEAGAASHATLSLKPADIEPVTNLAVKYLPRSGNISNISSVVNPDESWDRFILTWDPPKNFSADKIEV